MSIINVFYSFKSASVPSSRSSTQSSSSCLFIYDERRTQQQNNVLKLERPTINHVMRGGGREGKPHTINHNSNEGALGTTQLEGVCQAPIINKHMGRHTTNMLLIITRETCSCLVRFSFAFGTRQTIQYYQKIMHHLCFYHKRSNTSEAIFFSLHIQWGDIRLGQR